MFFCNVLTPWKPEVSELLKELDPVKLILADLYNPSQIFLVTPVPPANTPTATN